MFIITVLPIARGLSKETLSYFSSKNASLGSLVHVPLRSRTIPGIVISCQKAEDLKSELKTLPYSMRKIEIIDKEAESESFLNEVFMKAVTDASIYFATTPGTILASLLPKTFFEDEIKTFLNKRVTPINEKNRRFEESAMQSDEDERVDVYKGIVREAFAKKESVFICLPTEESARRLIEILEKGIEKYSFLFLGGATASSVKKCIESIDEANHSVLVVGTSAFIPFLTSDTKTIIIEGESERFWKQVRRPYLDLREFIRFFAMHFKARLIYSDSLLRVETINRVNENEISEYSRIMAKRHRGVKTLVVNQKKDNEINHREKMFEVLSDELKEMITYAKKYEKSFFLFGTRRGIASQTVCRDCGETVLCHECSAPVVLHKLKAKGEGEEQKTGNVFICHHCGEKRSAEEICKHCGSWRLESFGIGIEKIKEEVMKLGIEEVLILDSESAPTGSKAKKILKRFTEKKGILIGTEMSLQYLDEESIDYSAIVSFDSLFSLPDFRIEEKIMHIILKAKSVAKDNFLLQGRNTDAEVVEFGTSGDLLNFAKYELSCRKKFKYPPFKTLIKITVTGDKEWVVKELSTVAELLKEYDPVAFPAFIKTIRKKTVCHILIKLEKSKWPDANLREKLLSLSPAIEVRIDPESLL